MDAQHCGVALCFVVGCSFLTGTAQVLDGASVAPGAIRTNAPVNMNVTAADPFDIETGIYYRNYTDMYMPGSIPIAVVRTQRNMDPRSRSFGIGASTSYDMIIVGDADKFSWVALVMADGSKETYTRTSPGTGYADAVFENQTSPRQYYGSRIFWNGHGGWTVQLRDGLQYTIHACSPASTNPGQCAVTEVRNAHGKRLTVQRDKAGNIQRITTPEGRYIAFNVDPVGRIKRIQDDTGNLWVNYHYNRRGALNDTWSWRGEKQEFGYDDHFNMIWVHETGTPSVNVCRNSNSAIPDSARPFLEPSAFAKGYDFTVQNQFDNEDRLTQQDTSLGQHWSVLYGTPAEDKSKITVVDSSDGSVRYFFNPAGYEVREEYSGRRTGWALEIMRQTGNNALFKMTLICMPRKTHLELPLTLYRQDGERLRAILSGMCGCTGQKSGVVSKAVN